MKSASSTRFQENKRLQRALAALKRRPAPNSKAVADMLREYEPDSALDLAEEAFDRGLAKAAKSCLEHCARTDSDAPEHARLDAMRANLLLGRFDEGFQIGESLLDASASAVTLESLSNRLSGRTPGRVVSPALLKRLSLYASRHPRNPWPITLLVDVLHKLNRREEALLLGARLKNFSHRYAWMRYPYGWMLLLDKSDYSGAVREFSVVAKAWPAFWHARAHLAEVRLLRGNDDAAFKLFDELLGGLGGYDRAQALSWRGELNLWTGRYRPALADLDAGVQGGAPFALAWRGAAKMLLGRPEAALADLNEYLKSYSDFEALVWRGECLRRAGKTRQALRDLDSALSREEEDPWARINRALCGLSLGKLSQAQEDFEALQPDVRKWLGPGPLKRVLEGGLKRARGLRRNDAYLRPFWLKAP